MSKSFKFNIIIYKTFYLLINNHKYISMEKNVCKWRKMHVNGGKSRWMARNACEWRKIQVNGAKSRWMAQNPWFWQCILMDEIFERFTNLCGNREIIYDKYLPWFQCWIQNGVCNRVTATNTIPPTSASPKLQPDVYEVDLP